MLHELAKTHRKLDMKLKSSNSVFVFQVHHDSKDSLFLLNKVILHFKMIFFPHQKSKIGGLVMNEIMLKKKTKQTDHSQTHSTLVRVGLSARF